MIEFIELENENGITREIEVEFDYVKSSISRNYYEPDTKEELNLYQVFFKKVDITNKLSENFLEYIKEEIYNQIID